MLKFIDSKEQSLVVCYKMQTVKKLPPFWMSFNFWQISFILDSLLDPEDEA